MKCLKIAWPIERPISKGVWLVREFRKLEEALWLIPIEYR